MVGATVEDVWPVDLVTVVVPVYRGATSLRPLVAEILPLTETQRTPRGYPFRVAEVLLVHDAAIDESADVIEALTASHAFVHPLWLSRTFGQHAATLAGMASSSSEWIVTLDEDGQHAPHDIGKLLDRAHDTGAQLIYATGENRPPHSYLRNLGSRMAKRVFRWLVGRQTTSFNSFRLIWGETGRSLAAYCGNSVYLDVALSWIVPASETCPVVLRGGSARPSGYRMRSLAAHFWRLVITSGTRPLRFIFVGGVLALLCGLGLGGYALWEKLTHQVPVQGWTSTVILISLFSSAILFSLGVLAEYLGVALNTAMGRPLYTVTSRCPTKAIKRP